MYMLAGVAFEGLDLTKTWYPAVSLSTLQQVCIHACMHVHVSIHPCRHVLHAQIRLAVSCSELVYPPSEPFVALAEDNDMHETTTLQNMLRHTCPPHLQLSMAVDTVAVAELGTVAWYFEVLCDAISLTFGVLSHVCVDPCM